MRKQKTTYLPPPNMTKARPIRPHVATIPFTRNSPTQAFIRALGGCVVRWGLYKYGNEQQSQLCIVASFCILMCARLSCAKTRESKTSARWPSSRSCACMFASCPSLVRCDAEQLVLAGDMDGGVDDQGQHSTSVLVHRVRDWTEWNTEEYGGASGPSRAQQIPPLAGGSRERFVDQRRYANISRCVSPSFTPMSAPHFF